MFKKLTITVPEAIYLKLHKRVQKRKISSFITSKIRPFLEEETLVNAYRDMAQDKQREKAASEFTENTIPHLEHEAW